MPETGPHHDEHTAGKKVRPGTDGDHAVTMTTNDPQPVVIHRDVLIVKKRDG